MKTKLLITILGLMPALAIAEVTVNQTSRGGESVTYTPSSTAGRTASGATYERTTTAPGQSTLEIQGANGGTLSDERSGRGNNTLNASGANGDTVTRFVQDGNKYTYVDTPKYDTSRTKSTDGQKTVTIDPTDKPGSGVSVIRGGGQQNEVLVSQPGTVTQYTANKSTTPTGQTEVTVTKSDYPTGTQEGQKTFVIVNPPQPAK
jgi:hypothetical protein